MDDAVASYREALRIEPDYAKAHYNLGNVLQEQGRLDDAVACYREALRIEPALADAHNNLGNALQKQDRLDDAVTCYREALRIESDYAMAHYNLGDALQKQDRLDDAVACYREALRIDPDYADAHNNLGNALKEQGRLDDATACYREALRIEPDYAAAHNNLGAALKDQGRLDDAVACCREALRIEPDYAEAHFNLGMFHLLMGRFDDGWSEYKWRWRVKGDATRPREYREPLWNGGDLAGQKIYLYAEQGIGDTIQFVRYLPLIAERGGQVIFESPAPLFRLLRDIDGATTVIPRGEPSGAFDCHAALLDLPRILHTTLETIPASIPYLRVNPDLKKAWATRLGPSQDFRIGIVWAGSPLQVDDHNRSMDVSLFEPLTQIPGVSIYSLQIMRNGEATKILGEGLTDLAPDVIEFTETAAAIVNLDLVVSVDTAVVHLAGALGRPVWTLLPFSHDWRWLLGRDDSPWYPTMRLFRQEKHGDWKGVIGRVVGELTDELRARP